MTQQDILLKFSELFLVDALVREYSEPRVDSIVSFAVMQGLVDKRPAAIQFRVTGSQGRHAGGQIRVQRGDAYHRFIR